MKIEIKLDNDDTLLDKVNKLLEDSPKHHDCHGFIDCLGKGEFIHAWDYFIDSF